MVKNSRQLVSAMAFGKRIREERLRLELSQAALAVIGRVSKATQVAYEAENSSPDLIYLDRIAAAGVDSLYVVSGRRLVDIELDGINWHLAAELMRSISAWERENDVELPDDERIEHLRAIYNERHRKMADARTSMVRAIRNAG